MPTIVIRHPNGTTEERDVTGKLTVGCDDGNDLVLRAGGVSQRHAQFFADGGELVLENVGSAAATLVDGESIGRPTKLRAGVKVLIGEYEVTLKPDQQQMLVRKVALPSAASTLTDEPAGGPARSSSALALIAGGALVLAILGGGAALLLRPAPPAVVEVIDTTPKPNPADPCSDVEALLRPAREPASQKSLAAAQGVLDCDPLNKEAAQLKLSIEEELKGLAAAERGTRLVDIGRDVEGLAAFREIPAHSRIFVTTQAQALIVAERIEKSAAESCRTYSRDSRWVQAASSCEQAMNIRCQGMKPEELSAPISKPQGWKPKEPLLAMLLKAREKIDPRLAPWACPPTPILKPLTTLPDKSQPPAAGPRKSSDPQISAALALYAKGSVDQAIVQLQVVKEKSEKAAVHAEAEQLRTEMVTVDSLQKIGLRDLESGDLEKAARSLREALDADGRLMLGPGASPTELERQPSAARRAIVTSAAQQALRIGRPLAQHGDLKRACAAWRVGFTFYRGNSELNEMLNTCSGEAKRLLDSARDCPALTRAQELAVTGDNLAEQITARKLELKCP